MHTPLSEWKPDRPGRRSPTFGAVLKIAGYVLAVLALHAVLCAFVAGDDAYLSFLGALGLVRKPPVTRSNGCNVQEVSPEEWESLLQQFPHHTVFHRLPWLRAVEESHGVRVRLAKAQIDGHTVSIWPLFTSRKGPLRILGSPLPGCNTAYLGPLFSTCRVTKQALAAYLNHPLFRCSYFACKAISNGHLIDLAPHGFQEVLRFDTYCLELGRPRSELWANLKSECRTQIRKARRLGVQIQRERDASFIDDYWAMAVDTFANTNVRPSYSREFLHSMWSSLHASNSICVLTARHNGERIAGLILPFDDHTMYYWSGASYLRCRGVPANNLLTWCAIKEAQRLGLQRYDFISTLGGGGRFKRTFGPDRVQSAIHWERASSPLIRLIKNCYEQYLMRRQQIRA